MEYKTITSLEEVSGLAIKEINGDDYRINFNLKVNFHKELITKKMEDVYQDALDFQNSSLPASLYMNHGEFIHKFGDGIKNVVNQLKEKHASNRAIISLINQEDIMESKDNPIPSFMVLQFSIENHDQLYVTAYFRALEVSKFLRINTEEIRQIIEKIFLEHRSLEQVFLNIFAFRAYINSDINPLKKPKIDTFTQKNIFKYLKKEKNLSDFIGLLNEKKTSSTVIEYSSFEDILSWLEDEEFSDQIHSSLTKPIVISILKEIIFLSKSLKDLREKVSHSQELTDTQDKFKEKIENLISEIR